VGQVLRERVDDKGDVHYLAAQNVTFKRAITPAFWVATLVLLAVCVLIAFELTHRRPGACLRAEAASSLALPAMTRRLCRCEPYMGAREARAGKSA
jgi:hypothetical protein